MARVRRKTAAANSRLNFEIAGIAAIGLALLLGCALALPPARSGIVGEWTAYALHQLFGSAAGWFPVLVALVGGIVFLEINVPQMIATLGTSSSSSSSATSRSDRAAASSAPRSTAACARSSATSAKSSCWSSSRSRSPSGSRTSRSRK
jgi:hypothetical protein